MAEAVQNLAWHQAATSGELRRWADVEARARRVDAIAFRAGLLLENMTIAYRFGAARGVPLAPVPADLESRFLFAWEENMRVQDAVRKIGARQWGARWNGKDFDAIDPSGGAGLEGIFIPIAIGAVALAGLVSRLIWVEKENTDLGGKYNAILEKTDRVLCSDPKSTTCQDWQREKTVSNYQRNVTMADSIKGAVGSIGAGLGKGLLIALPVLAALLFWRR